MKIKLRNSEKTALVDDSLGYLSQYSWRLTHNGYAEAWVNNRSVYMHRFIVSPKENMFVDHMNRDKLDNRLANLRECTKSDNQHNSKKPSNNTSGYKGVSYRKDKKRYVVYIRLNSKKMYVGSFIDPIAASRAYINKAQELYGEYAYAK